MPKKILLEIIIYKNLIKIFENILWWQANKSVLRYAHWNVEIHNGINFIGKYLHKEEDMVCSPTQRKKKHHARNRKRKAILTQLRNQWFQKTPKIVSFSNWKLLLSY